MTVEQAVKDVKALQMQQHAYAHAEGMLYLDSVTQAPKGSAEARGKTLEILSEDEYKRFVNDEVRDLLFFLRDNRAALDAQTAREAEVLLEDYEKLTRIPMEEYVAFSVLVNEAQAVWHEAKEKSDYAMFKPYLEKLIEANRRFAGYYDAKAKPYDALLNEYEKGFTMDVLDPYFAQVKAELVPLLRRVKDIPVSDGFLYKSYPVPLQRKLSDELMRVMGIDRAHCNIGETEHPFTINFSKYDVRITTHYHENALASSMYSVIHEGGHALYELGTADALQYGALASGASMGLHESQSRFFENIIGRSEAFIDAVFPIITDLFPEQLSGVSAYDFFRAVNRAQPSLIRTEADELTYSLHVMVRYELEKRLIEGTLSVDELPAAWNALYTEYLGVDVLDDRRGVLQDSHWSGGSFGYFPSYSLGSAYAAQMLFAMRGEVDVEGSVARGDLEPVKAWLVEKIHRHGRMYEPKALLEMACGAPFDPKYYTRYLTEKFTALYSL